MNKKDRISYLVQFRMIFMFSDVHEGINAMGSMQLYIAPQNPSQNL